MFDITRNDHVRSHDGRATNPLLLQIRPSTGYIVTINISHHNQSYHERRFLLACTTQYLNHLIKHHFEYLYNASLSQRH